MNKILMRNSLHLQVKSKKFTFKSVFTCKVITIMDKKTVQKEQL